MVPIPPRAPSRLSRRHFLLIAGASGTLVACGSTSTAGPEPTTTPAPSSTTSPPTTSPPTTTVGGDGLTVVPDCVLTPASAEGPFHADINLVRADMAEGRAGVPLDIELMIVDAETCTPLANASMDLWHADAGGLYSAFGGQGDDRNIDTSDQTFLRGIQSTNADGLATIRTVYPGWYPGRTTHVHLKVHFETQTLVTTQLYFPEDISESVYTTAAYADRGPKDTSNRADGLGAENADLRMTLAATDTGYRATHVIGVLR